MITSVSNPQVKQVIQLNTKGKVRKELGLFCAEGIKLYREAPRAWIRRVYAAASFAEAKGDLLAGTAYETVEDRVFAKMCDTRTPQGILTVLAIPSWKEEDLLRDVPLLMVLEDLQDPGNVGTILRTAEGAGVTGLVLSRNCADLFAPKTIRSTMGSIYRMPFVVSEDLPQTLARLKRAGVRTYAAHLQGSIGYRQGDYKKPTAFLIGNEGRGLSEALAGAADVRIRIPMEGQVESLNAAVASAVLMYEAQGQRVS